MSFLIFKESTVELSTRNEPFLNNPANLILEFSSNEKSISKVNLSSRSSSYGAWDTKQIVNLPKEVIEFTVSVLRELDGNGHQLIGSIELSRSTLQDTLGNLHEIPLNRHEDSPSLIFKSRIEAMENVPDAVPDIRDEDALAKMRKDATTAYHDFEQHGNLESLNRAILHLQTASEITSKDNPELPGILDDLSRSLSTRFNRLGGLDDINNAVARQLAAAELTRDGHPDKPNRLRNLGNYLQSRFERLGNFADVNDAIVRKQAAVDFLPDGHADKPAYLSDLGSSFYSRFNRLGNPADMDQAILQQQEAVRLTPDNNSAKLDYLNELGSAFQSRFERFGNIDDLENGLTQRRASIGLIANDHPDKPTYLSRLGTSLMTRFERLGNIADLDSAIIYTREAVDLTPDEDSQRPSRLNSLGACLLARFLRLRGPSDLDDAISSQQAGVNLMDNRHPDTPRYLNKLGSAFKIRFELSGNLDDINNAITRNQEAVNLTMDGHPQKMLLVRELGDCFWTRFGHLHRNEDVEAAISHMSAAAMSQTGPPTIRFNTAERWISIASSVNHSSLLAGYECALGILPLVAWPGLPLGQRHQHLVQIGGLSREAVAAAIAHEQYDKALEWLEQGRSIVWTQISQLRAPVGELRGIDPNLADRLSHISRLMDRQTGSSSGTSQLTEDNGQQYRAIVVEREALIDQVRSLPNSEAFLKSPRSSQLMNAAQNGPVIVLNAAKSRCDALALVPGLDEAIHIPLPDITYDRLTELREELKDIVSHGIRTRGELKVEDRNYDQDCRRILAELWKRVVKPVLDSLALSPNTETLPRIWWCPMGPFAFLPIHAAGIYDLESVDSQLSDYTISSYTPTLSTLLKAQTSERPLFQLLSVIQPSAPGGPSIPSTKQELESILRHVGTRNHLILEGSEGTKGRVMGGMRESNWLHLACHGVQNPGEPTKSALILEDGHLTLEDIIRMDLPNAEMAFLSAGQTTTGDENLSEEAAHIAGGMLLAGYRGVVAMMWSIRHELLPEVVDTFYDHIMKEGERPDSRRAAEALHLAVQRLRKKEGIRLIDWVPFVHLGV